MGSIIYYRVFHDSLLFFNSYHAFHVLYCFGPVVNKLTYLHVHNVCLCFTAPGTIELPFSTKQVDEGIGTFQVLVKRTGGSDGAAKVTLLTKPGTATSNEYFVFVIPPPVPGTTVITLDFSDGDETVLANIVIIEDQVSNYIFQ